MTQSSLHNAKRAKQDEFYTQLSDIENELKHYRAFFENKTVFCNCDDPFESNFFKYFAMNFNFLKLKKLICTCYAGSLVSHTELGDLPLFRKDGKTEKLPYLIQINEVKDENGDGAVDMTDIEELLKNDKNVLTLLDGDGDFRSEESIMWLKESDVVVTNPPFSLFREYVAQLVKYNKKFIIIGNKNAITYKEIFPLIKDNKLWLGASIHSGGTWFRVPDYYNISKNFKIDEKGRRYVNIPGPRWFTNVDYPKRHEDLILYKKYTPEVYPKYDNYDAINVDKVADIPCDYFPSNGTPRMVLLESRLPSSTSLTRVNSKLSVSGMPARQETSLAPANAKPYPTERKSNGMDQRSAAKQSTSASLSGGKCNGIMGVPITFLDKYNPDQFEIIGATESEGKGFSCGLWDKESGVTQPLINNKRLYKRIFIRRKQ